MFQDIHGLKDCPLKHWRKIDKFYAMDCIIIVVRKVVTNGRKTYVCVDFATELVYQPIMFYCLIFLKFDTFTKNYSIKSRIIKFNVCFQQLKIISDFLSV